MAESTRSGGMMERVSHYVIQQALGRGGSSTVYRALDSRDGSTVALKVLHPHLASDAGYRTRFDREAKIAARLRSPHAVRLLDSGRQGDSFFLAMEFVDGSSLASLLAQGRLSVDKAVSIARQICLALTDAHDAGIVHRDIKPQNIMLDTNGAVKVTDFGVARWEGQPGITTDGLYLGTPEYMSPEHVNGRVDGRSDIYSLGIVMYQMLAGSTPFTGSPFSVIDMQLRVQPESLSRVDPSLPAWLTAIVHRCLEKDPNRRFASANELLRALERREPAVPADTYSPVSVVTPSSAARPSDSGHRAHRQSTSSRKRVVLLSGLVACLFVFTVVVTAAASEGRLTTASIPVIVMAGSLAFALLFGASLVTRPQAATFVLRMSNGQSFELRKGKLLVGRAHDAGIRLSAPEVSRHHAHIHVSAKRVTLEDLGSGNGSYVNGARIQTVTELFDGDEVAFGTSKARLVHKGSPTA